mgnify:FL=1
MKKEENILGYENIKTLMKKFSIPCIISLVVNALYNIVDQIYIGWGVGYLGNGATNIIFPITVVALAFALMLGDGTSAYLSLKLGEKKKDEAKKGVCNGIISSVIVSLLLCIICLIFLPKLIYLFGCTKALKKFALEYGYVIALGLPFVMIGTTLNSIIRADGSPKYAMTSMVTGAILNIILDPIFIFVFHMQVKGAAIATVISQIVTFIMNIAYLRKFKSITLTKKDYKFNLNITKNIAMLGISSFITQMSIVIVIAVQNNMLAKYGVYSKYGTEIPITVIGIVMKINQILNSIIIGIAAGSQPIIGYNYGASNYKRVKETLKYVIKVSLFVGLVAFVLFQTIPEQLISIFGSGSELYNEFACLTFRIMLLLTICNSVQIVSGIFFQAIGKSGKSAFLSLSRQILFLIPAMIIMSSIIGVKGVLYAGPIADGLAFIISVILLITENKNLNKKEVNITALSEDIKESNILKNKIIITIAREYGSGGRYVGRLVAQKLGIKFYDKYIMVKLAEETGLSLDYIESNEQKRDNIANISSNIAGLTTQDNLYLEESKLIKSLSSSSCVIIGRCADDILKDEKNILKVFIYSDMDDKIKRVTTHYNIDKKNALKEIKRINKLRSNHYKHYTGKNWGMPDNYDLCINSDLLGVEKTAEIISDMAIAKAEKR